MSEEREQITLPEEPEALSGNSQRGLFFRAFDSFGGTTTLDPIALKRKYQRIFIITFLLGSTLILANAQEGLKNVFFCSLLMFVYMLIGLRMAVSVAAKSVFADSIYYLGFLFTFVALLAGMLTLENADPKVIIGQMGSAIATTIIGMFLRIYITQFEAITSEPDAEILSGLGELSNTLSSAIISLETSLKANIESSQELQKRNIKLSEEFNNYMKQLDFRAPANALDELTKSIASAATQLNFVDTASATLQTASERLVGKINTTENTLEKSRQNFNDLSNLAAQIESTKNSVAVLQKEADDGTSKMSNLNLDKLVTSMSDVNARLEGALTSSSTIQKSLSDTQGLASSIKSRISDSEGNVASFNKSIAELEDLGRESQKTKDTLESLQSSAKNTSEAIDREKKETDKAIQGIVSKTSKEASESIKNLSKSIEETQLRFGEVKKELDGLTNRVKVSISEVIEFLSRSK